MKMLIEPVRKIIDDKVMSKALANYTVKARNNRGIIIYDYRS